MPYLLVQPDPMLQVRCTEPVVDLVLDAGVLCEGQAAPRTGHEARHSVAVGVGVLETSRIETWLIKTVNWTS